MGQPNIKIWVRDRIIFLALFIFVLGASAYILTGTFFSPDSIWLHPIKEFSLLISMIGVVSLGYELFLRELTFNEYKRALQEIVNPDAVRLGIKGIYKNRSELGHAHSFDSLFKNVKSEIFIGGSSLLSISTNSREILREKVLSGITVKLLLMDPHSKVADLIATQESGKHTFKNEIKTSLLLLQRLQNEIESETTASKKGKLIIHTYDFIPSHSFIAVDAQESGGAIIVDMGPYLGRNVPRPTLLVVHKKNGMYDYWKEMNNALWEESGPPQRNGMSLPASKTKTLFLVSGKETEYYDTKTDSWHQASVCEMGDKWKALKGSQWVWIRESISLEKAKTGGQNRFRVEFHIPLETESSIVRADLFVRSDDTCRIVVNDIGLPQQYGGAEYPDPFMLDIGKYIKSGCNTITFEVQNFAKPSATSPGDNPTGLIYRLHVEYKSE